MVRERDRVDLAADGVRLDLLHRLRVLGEALRLRGRDRQIIDVDAGGAVVVLLAAVVDVLAVPDLEVAGGEGLLVVLVVADPACRAVRPCKSKRWDERARPDGSRLGAQMAESAKVSSSDSAQLESYGRHQRLSWSIREAGGATTSAGPTAGVPPRGFLTCNHFLSLRREDAKGAAALTMNVPMWASVPGSQPHFECTPREAKLQDTPPRR